MRNAFAVLVILLATVEAMAQNVVHDYLYIKGYDLKFVSVTSTAFEKRLVPLPKGKLKDVPDRTTDTILSLVQEYEALGWELVEIKQERISPSGVYIMRKPKH